ADLLQERRRTEQQLAEDAVRDAVNVVDGIAGQLVGAGAGLLEADPERVEERDHADRDDNQGGRDRDGDRRHGSPEVRHAGMVAAWAAPTSRPAGRSREKGAAAIPLRACAPGPTSPPRGDRPA